MPERPDRKVAHHVAIGARVNRWSFVQFFVGLSLFLISFSTVFGQAKETRALGDAQSLYERGDFVRSLQKLRAIDQVRLTDSQRATIQYLTGSAAFALDSLVIAQSALAAAHKLPISFERQSFVSLRLGHIATLQSRLTDAFGWYLIAATSDIPAVVPSAKGSLESLLRHSDLRLESLVLPSPISSSSFCELVKTLGAVGKRLTQIPSLQTLASNCQLPVANSSGKITIALVLPFSGENAPFALQLADGIEAARSVQGESAYLTIRRYDTRSRAVDAALIARQLHDTLCDLVIGPLTSEEAAAFSAAAGHLRCPILIPAASDAGLTSLHPRLYQLAPTIVGEATMMARSAREFLRADTAVILVPDLPDYAYMGETFAKVFSENGGTVLFRRSYDPRQKDFGTIFSDLKISVGRGVDSTRVMLNAAGDTLKPEHQPGGVDCIYAPCSATQARTLLPQLAFYTVQGGILGSTAWNEKSVFADAGSIVSQTFFPGSLLDRGCTQADELKSALASMRASTKGKKPADEQPQRLERLGFDAMLLAMRISADPNLLIDGSRDCGSAGMISFDGDRVNQPLRLCQWRGGAAFGVGIR